MNRATRSGAGTRRSEPRPAAARPSTGGPTTRGMGRRGPASRSASSISHSVRRRPRAAATRWRRSTRRRPPGPRPESTGSAADPAPCRPAGRRAVRCYPCCPEPPTSDAPADHATTSPRTLVEKIWDDARRRRGAGRAGRPRRRPPPRPRGHQPAGVHRAARARAARSGGPTRPSPPPTTRRRPRRAGCPMIDMQAARADQPARGQLPRVRHPAPRVRQRHPGHRPRHRPGARAHPAGHDDRVRRLAHRDPRRVRGARVRDRDERGRDGPRDPDACSSASRRPTRSASTAGCAPGVSAKDIILALIARIGIGGGTGHVFEYRGEAIRALTMEQRMTICNMSIEGGARAGLIAPDDTTFEYLHGRRHAPQGAAWDAAVAGWRTLPTDDGAAFDKLARRSTPAALEPMVTCGNEPGHGHRRSRGRLPRPEDARGRQARGAASSARSSTWACSPASRSPATRSTSCSSAAAPTAGSATCASPRASSKAATSPTACG